MVTKRAAGARVAAAPARRLFTVEEYHRMGEVGVLAENERIELIEGEIFCMSPIGTPHTWVVVLLNKWFSKWLPDDVFILVQDAIHLGPRSEPEPDLVIVRARPRAFSTPRPGPQDILLLVEVSSSSLRYDLEVKLPLYAAAGIVEVWIIDLDGRRALVCRAPRDGAYTQQHVVESGGALIPTAFPDLALPLNDLLGTRG